MDTNQINTNQSLETQLELELNSSNKEEVMNENNQEINTADEKQKIPNVTSENDTKILSVGQWMITILLFLLPVVNIIVMAVWAFSSKGNVNRRNLSRASLLWIIILLIAYVVAMTIAGFTIMDLFV